MRIDGQRAVTKARSISFVARAALICLIKNPHDTFRKPRTWSFVLPAWRRNQCSGLRAWKLRDGKYFFADVPIARTCFERTPITTPNVYKVRSPMTVYSARRGVVPRRRSGEPPLVTCITFTVLKGLSRPNGLLLIVSLWGTCDISLLTSCPERVKA